MQDFVDALRQASRDEEALRIAEADEQQRRDAEDRLLYATHTGMEKGLKKGIEKGREEGREEGREKGREEGREEGLQKGRQEGQQGVLINLLEHLPPERVAKMTKLPLNEILNVKKQKS